MAIDKELLKGSTVILILALLDREPMYGYQMMSELSEGSSGVFQFKEGTLYPILHALEAEGYVTAYWWEGEGARRRKYYEITADGRRQLQAKRAEWARFRGAVEQIIGEGHA